MMNHKRLRADPKTPENRVLDAYLDRLKSGSARSLRQGLDQVARVLLDDKEVSAEQVLWHLIRASDLIKARDRLPELSLRPSTITKIMAAVRGVARSARDLGLMGEKDFQAIADVPPPDKPAGKPPRTLSEDQIVRLFEVCAEDRTARGRRDAALLALILATGARRSECTALDRAHVLLTPTSDARVTIAEGHHERERIAELVPGAAAALADWVALRGDAPGPLLWAVARGGRLRRTRLNDQSVYAVLTALGNHTEIERLSGRDLRRTCVARLIAAGLPYAEVAERTGLMSWFTPTLYRELTAEPPGEEPPRLDLPYVPPNRS